MLGSAGRAFPPDGSVAAERSLPVELCSQKAPGWWQHLASPLQPSAPGRRFCSEPVAASSGGIQLLFGFFSSARAGFHRHFAVQTELGRGSWAARSTCSKTREAPAAASAGQGCWEKGNPSKNQRCRCCRPLGSGEVPAEPRLRVRVPPDESPLGHVPETLAASHSPLLSPFHPATYLSASFAWPLHKPLGRSLRSVSLEDKLKYASP